MEGRVKQVKGINCMAMMETGSEHAVVYRSRNIMLYTWNLHNVINQCYLNEI